MQNTSKVPSRVALERQRLRMREGARRFVALALIAPRGEGRALLLDRALELARLSRAPD